MNKTILTQQICNNLFSIEMHLQNEKLKQQTEDMKAKTAAALEETKENESEIVDIQKSKEL